MHTNKDLLIKGLKHLGYTTLLMFIAPILFYQAFKNEGHPFYWPVVILGAIAAIAAIAMGFYSIKVFMDAIFTKKENRK